MGITGVLEVCDTDPLGVTTALDDDGVGIPEEPAGLLEEGELEDRTGELEDPTGVLEGPTGMLEDPTGVLEDPMGVLEGFELEGVADDETTGILELGVFRGVEEAAGELDGTLELEGITEDEAGELDATGFELDGTLDDTTGTDEDVWLGVARGVDEATTDEGLLDATGLDEGVADEEA